MPKQPQCPIYAPLLNILYLQSLPNVIISQIVPSYLAALPCTHIDLCHFPFLHVRASHRHCLHQVGDITLIAHSQYRSTAGFIFVPDIFFVPVK